jgi:hypothetical protein
MLLRAVVVVMPVVVALAAMEVSAQSASRGYDNLIVWYGSGVVGLVSKMFLTFRKGLLSMWEWNSFADAQAS